MHIMTKLLLFSTLCLISSSIFSATPIDLSQHNVKILSSFISLPALKGAHADDNAARLKEISKAQDFNQTLHIKLKETYNGYPVWGGDAIVHIPKGQSQFHSLKGMIAADEKSNTSMNGIFYKNIDKDLENTPHFIFSPKQMKKSLGHAVKEYKNKNREALIANENSSLVVYIDRGNKAHWAFHVRFSDKSKQKPSIPNFLIDASTFTVYQVWDTVKSLDNVKVGGFGGNIKVGKTFYDGFTGKLHLPQLDMQRDPNEKICYFTNDIVSVTDYRTNKLVEFPCPELDMKRGAIYWNGDLDATRGAYSPSNDALFAGKIIFEMYQNWYDTPVLMKNNEPMKLEMVTHFGIEPDNAVWDPFEQKMYFGDGEEIFYPLTSLDVAAHEISHGFTEQHSDLIYYGESGSINESFSDMAGQAAQFYYSHTNDWKIGAQVMLGNSALRYMDQPSKDCVGMESMPAGEICSIDSVTDYEAYVKRHSQDFDVSTRFPNVHFGSGIFNRLFYELAHYKNWDTKKAFDVMVQANRYYWTASASFIQAACGILKAIKDYKYEIEAANNAFDKVGLSIDTTKC